MATALLGPAEILQVAERMLADYDAHRPNEIFAERGTDWLTLEDAYAVQRAVAELRRARGERCLGYKVGCVSPAIQRQFGLREPVRGCLWESVAHATGCDLEESRFSHLAIEGEMAVRLRRDILADSLNSPRDLSECVETWFPVIELHNYIFRGRNPTRQELVAGNAMHAGFVAPADSANQPAAGLDEAEIQIEIDGTFVESRLFQKERRTDHEPERSASLRARSKALRSRARFVESNRVTALPGGPLGSLRWLASSLAAAQESPKAGQIILTGSPGQLIPIDGPCLITVTSGKARVQASVR